MKLITEERLIHAKTVLTNIRGMTEAFLQRAAGYKKLDGGVRAELWQVFKYVIEAVREFEAAGRALVEQILLRLGVKEPEKWASRLRLVLSGLTVAARVIETRLKP